MRFDRHNVTHWAASACFAIIAAWSLIGSLASGIRARSDGWGTLAFIAVFELLFATPFALAAYFCFARRYRDLFMVGVVVGALVLLDVFLTVPRQLGIVGHSPTWREQEPWQSLLMLALSLVLLFGPFYLVGWFIRICSRFATRRFPNA